MSYQPKRQKSTEKNVFAMVEKIIKDSSLNRLERGLKIVVSREGIVVMSLDTSKKYLNKKVAFSRNSLNGAIKEFQWRGYNAKRIDDAIELKVRYLE